MKYSKNYKHLNLWDSLVPLVWKAETIWTKFKTCFSELIAENLLKQQSLKQTSHFGRKYSNLTLFFWSKNIEVFLWLSKSKVLRFVMKVNQSNGNERKSDIFSVGHIQIWHHFPLIEKYSKISNTRN